jgi:hypothetical protein
MKHPAASYIHSHLDKLGSFYIIFDMLCRYIFSHDFSDKYAEITGKITQPTRFNAPCYTGKAGLIFKELNDRTKKLPPSPLLRAT